MSFELQITLLSDATFGRGDGVAGLIDEEVDYDEKTGLPFIRGRVLKGLLTEECANILYALQRGAADPFCTAAEALFGSPGSKAKQSILNIGAAELPEQLRTAVAASIQASLLNPSEALESLTALRRQTATDDASGAPDEGSLRTMRVVLRSTVFIAPLTAEREMKEHERALLAACVLALRRGGTGRNRGRGRLKACLLLDQKDVTGDYFEIFKSLTEVVA